MDQCCSYSDGYYGQPWPDDWMYGDVCMEQGPDIINKPPSIY